MIQIFHNPQCSKSNCALDYLKEHKIAFELRDYQQEPLSVAELKEICQLLAVGPESIIRKNEKLFIENFLGKNYSDEEWFEILAENPVLLQRPILVNEDKAVIARPPELIDSLIS